MQTVSRKSLPRERVPLGADINEFPFGLPCLLPRSVELVRLGWKEGEILFPLLNVV